MPFNDNMEYYSSFPRAILLSKACCIRVTHPFAGRRPVQAPALPLDLHVLSLPLAFILSQDQTLRSNLFLSKEIYLLFKVLDLRIPLACLLILLPFSIFLRYFLF